jgi:hypothetical protein
MSPRIGLPMPTPKNVQEFKRLYLQEYGEEITDATALELAISVLTLVYLGTSPLKSESPLKPVTLFAEESVG